MDWPTIDGKEIPGFLETLADGKPELQITTHTTFDIECAKISYEFFNPHIVYKYPIIKELPFKMAWCRFPYSKVRSLYEKTKGLYEIEMAALEKLSDPPYCYFLVRNLFNSYYTPSDRWVIAGCIGMSDGDVITWVWMHPFLRNKGLFKRFLFFYASHIAPLQISPPISKDMEYVIKSFSKEYATNDSFRDDCCRTVKAFISEVTKESVSDFSNEEIERLKVLSNDFLNGLTQKNVVVSQQQRIKTTICMIDLIRNMRNPESKKELEDLLIAQGFYS